MTLAEAKTILQTYTMPMTAGQLQRYRIALMLVSGGFLRGI